MSFRETVTNHQTTLQRNRDEVPSYEEAVVDLVRECTAYDCFRSVFGDNFPNLTTQDGGVRAMYLIGGDNGFSDTQSTLAIRLGANKTQGFMNVHAVSYVRASGSDVMSDRNPLIPMHEAKLVAHTPHQVVSCLTDIICDHIEQFADTRDATVMRAMLKGEEQREDLAPSILAVAR